MDKNVLVDQSPTNSIATTIPSSTSFTSHIKATTTNLPSHQLTSVLSSSIQKNSIGDSEISIPMSYSSSNKETAVSTSSSMSKLKAEVDQLDDLVKDLLTEVNRPLPTIDHRICLESPLLTTEPITKSSSFNQVESIKPIREERIRIKRGIAMEFPVDNSSSSPIKPNISTSIDEQLIDSLLESVQNTLRKRAQQTSTTLPNHSGGHNRRTHSSSSVYADSVHRLEPIRTRFPIKLNRSDSPTSTISSRRPHSRDGCLSPPTTSNPTHFRATSEPPPDGPIELRRMDLVRSPSRTYFDVPPSDYCFYPRSTLPYRGYRSRARDYSGYESDTGSNGFYVYPNRFYRIPPPIYPPYHQQRPMVRADGYDTDSGLISSGRLRMTRPSPVVSSRMAVIPETYMTNNRMFSSSNTNGVSVHSRHRAESCTTGYDTDFGVNARYGRNYYQSIPIQREEFTQRPVQIEQTRLIDDKREKRSTSIPVVTEQKTSVDIDVQTSKISPTLPVTSQHYDSNVEKRVIKNSSGYVEENSRQSSLSSAAESGAYQAHNVSRFWYKEKMSRDDAIQLLKTKPGGTFLIRDSQGFPGSFGLAVKVDILPANIQPRAGADPNAELVRHYLIERTPTGHVRLKGCPNEPDFASLSELVYHHTLVPLALPIKLNLPTADIAENYRSTTSNEKKKLPTKELLEKGAACNVVYLNNVDVDSLSGRMAVAKALNNTFENVQHLQATIVNFKVSTSGITLVDTNKKLFSRRHFPKENVIYCGTDYEPERYWTHQYQDLQMLPRAKCFAFVSKKLNDQRSSSEDFECHVFAELEPTQPASAIVNFVSKVMIGNAPL